MKSILAYGILLFYLLASIGQVENVHICLSEIIPPTTSLFEKGASCCGSEAKEMSQMPKKSANDCCKNQSQFKKIFAGKAHSCSYKLIQHVILDLQQTSIPKTIMERLFHNTKASISILLPNDPPPKLVAKYTLYLQWKFDV